MYKTNRISFVLALKAESVQERYPQNFFADCLAMIIVIKNTDVPA